MLLYFLLLVFLQILTSHSLSATSIPSTRTPPIKRKQSSITYDSISNSFYIYGGYQSVDEYFDDMWRFDLNTNTWEEIHSPSTLTPGPRFDSRMKVLKNERSILFYGGTTLKGPISDLWLFDIDNFMWKPIYTKGFTPPASYSSGGVFYEHNSKEYFAFYGGGARDGIHNRLFILDIETLSWSEAEYNAIHRMIGGSTGMEYYNGFIYIFGGYYPAADDTNVLLYYDIDQKVWNSVSLSSEISSKTIGPVSCVHNDYFYYLLGLDLEAGFIQSLWRINLKNPLISEKLEFTNADENVYRSYPSKYCKDGTLYVFGGFNYNTQMNDINTLDLSNIYTDDEKYVWKRLSRDMDVPTPRLGHAMYVYDGDIFIYGGRGKAGKNMIDVWKFDIMNEVWSPYPIQSQQPKARSDFAYTRKGDVLITYGGQGDEGLLDDMYLLNLKKSVWEEVQVRSKIKPVARKGSCMAVSGYTVIIFGGKTSAGYTDEVWTFDLGTGEYSQLFAEGEIQPLAYCKCKLETEGERLKFYAFFGESTGIRPMSFVFLLDIYERKWTQIRGKFYEAICRSEAAAVLLDNKILLVGGHQDGVIAYSDIYELDLPTDLHRLIGRLPTNVFSAGFVYYENKIFIHGGSFSFDILAVRNIPTNNLFIIHLNENCDSTTETCTWPCSKGTFLNSDSICQTCSPGTYSDKEGSSKCTNCPPGYYLNESAADSFVQCKLCNKGTYNSLEGQERCLDCEYTASCPIGSVSPVLGVSYKSSYNSSHPDLYQSTDPVFLDTEESLWLFLSLLEFLLLIIFLSIAKTREFLKCLDLYRDRHNYVTGSIMYRKKTLMGGIFTFVAMSITVTILVRSSISFNYRNIEESKVLVPNVAVMTKYDKFIAEKMIFEYTFKNYGGQCGYDGVCIKELEVLRDNILGKLDTPTCKKIQSDCYVKFECLNCELVKSGSIELILTEYQSFASDIYVKVTSSSSIPCETSSISTFISNTGNTIFRGIDPSIVFLYVTPSMFLSESSEWPSEESGYHISELTDPSPGTQIEVSQIPLTKNLKVRIAMDLNQSILLTDRFYVQSLALFFSSLAGSLLGIIGTVGFFMRISERIYLKIQDHISHKKLILEMQEKERQVNCCFDCRIEHDNFQPRHKRGESIGNSSSITFINYENSAIIMHSPERSLDTPFNTVANNSIKLREISTTSKRGSTIERRDDGSVDAKYFEDNDEFSNRQYKYSMVVPFS